MQYMKNSKQNMKPQDIVLLLKIISLDNDSWNQSSVAADLGISQAEISESVARSKNSGLLDPKGKVVMKYALAEFLQYGIRYAFPQEQWSEEFQPLIVLYRSIMKSKVMKSMFGLMQKEIQEVKV